MTTQTNGYHEVQTALSGYRPAAEKDLRPGRTVRVWTVQGPFHHVFDGVVTVNNGKHTQKVGVNNAECWKSEAFVPVR